MQKIVVTAIRAITRAILTETWLVNFSVGAGEFRCVSTDITDVPSSSVRTLTDGL